MSLNLVALLRCMAYVLFPIQRLLAPVTQDRAARAAVNVGRAGPGHLSMLGTGKARADKMQQAELALKCLEGLVSVCGPGWCIQDFSFLYEVLIMWTLSVHAESRNIVSRSVAKLSNGLATSRL